MWRGMYPPDTQRGDPVGSPLEYVVRLCRYAVKLLPHPHPPVAFGLLNVKPEPCMEVT